MEFTVDIDPKHEDALREWEREHSGKLFMRPGDLVQYKESPDIYLITADRKFYNVKDQCKVDTSIDSLTYKNGTRAFKLLYRSDNARV